MRSGEAVWREVLGDELYEDEADRRAHEELERLDAAMARREGKSGGKSGAMDLDDQLLDDDHILDDDQVLDDSLDDDHILDDSLDDDHVLDDSLDAPDAETFQRSLPREAETPEQRAESESAYFETPDAVETPLEQPARYRFLKYRGLQSFRLSPWDPKENLPAEYASLTEFADFEASQKAALAAQETRMAEEETPAGEPVLKAGRYVEVGVRVSRGWVEARAGWLPVLVSWLLPFEEKRTVMHATVQRCSAWTPAPLKSRDLLVAHVGFRRVPVRPLFAEAGLRCEKCKYVKWVPPTGFVQMVFYAPMSYRPAPVTLVLPRHAPGEVSLRRGSQA